MSSMNVVMRDPGFTGGSPDRSQRVGASPSTQPDANLEVLKLPNTAEMPTSPSLGEKTSVLSHSPKNAKTEVLTGGDEPIPSSSSPKAEYFTDKQGTNAPLEKLLKDAGFRFSKGEIVGGVARAAIAAPLVVGRLASALIEAGGTFLAVAAVPTLGAMFWSGMSFGALAGFCLGGFAVAGIGSFGGYLTDMCCHNVRWLFGDTKATWKQALPDGKYPWNDPSSYM